AAAVLLVLGGLCLGGAGMLMSRGQQREAIWVAVGGGVLFVASATLFFTRPQFDASKVVAVPAKAEGSGSTLPDPALSGKLVCTLDPKRSRVTVSTTTTVNLDLGEDGCINGKTQYAENGTHWQRILVPNEEATVSVLDFDPASRTYTNTRYLLSSDQMTRARQLRSGVTLKNCSNDQAARGTLVTRQQEIKAALPAVYNEKLVYSCTSTQ
ncbi:serine protease, partial [Sphingomonas sp. AOB5]|nr:serine protease [Sphingomonas sp. AOB5]